MSDSFGTKFVIYPFLVQGRIFYLRVGRTFLIKGERDIDFAKSRDQP